MFLLKQILPAAIIAMVIAAALSAGVRLLRNERLRHILVPFALALGYAAGHCFITGWTPFPPTDTTNWLPYFALAAAAAGSVLYLLDSKPTRIVLGGLVGIGAMRLLLDPKFRNGWTIMEGWLWVLGLAMVILLITLSWSAISRRATITLEVPVLLLIVCAGTSGALMLSGSLLLGQFATVLAAAVFGMVVFSLRSAPRAEGVVLGVSLLLVALLVSGYFFAELPASSAILLAAAPTLALIPVGKIGARTGFALRLILLCAPIGVALFLAFLSSPPLDY